MTCGLPSLTNRVGGADELLVTEGGADRRRERFDADVRAGDYRLAGPVVCDQCGRRYVGCAAHGSRCRYRYYSCFARHRYGGQECPADRLPADEIDKGVLGAVLAALEDDNLLEGPSQPHASTRRRDELARARNGQSSKLTSPRPSGRSIATSRVRGWLPPEAQCGEGVRALSEKIGELMEHRPQLDDACAEAELPMPTEEELTELRTKVRDAVASRELAPKKGLPERSCRRSV
ncbi:MAG: recombinase zinc ribbon domain-containing protein [Acidimicrobiales bacterium]